MRPMRSWPNSAGAGGTAICNQPNIGPTKARARPLVLHERAVALAERPERLIARYHRELLVIIIRILRLLRALDLEQVHVADDAAVDADFAVMRHEVVDRQLAHLRDDLDAVFGFGRRHRLEIVQHGTVNAGLARSRHLAVE